jgi:hypothetical protein
VCTNPFVVTRINTAPTVATPAGPTTVDCGDPTDYTCDTDDCDGDALSTEWSVSTDPGVSNGEWYPYTGGGAGGVSYCIYKYGTGTPALTTCNYYTAFGGEGGGSGPGGVTGPDGTAGIKNW